MACCWILSPMKNGIRQGCPLSLLLFFVSLEPIQCKICSNTDITGINAGATQYKLYTYADDLLFSLTNPASLPKLMKVFEEYGAVSNLKIYFGKSVAMGVRIAPNILTSLKDNFTFKWSDTALKYLDAHMPSNLTCTYELNFSPLQAETRLLLDK